MKHTILFVMAALGLNGSAAWANHDAALVQGWYQQYLHRDVEPGGLHSWMSVLHRNGSLAVQSGLLGSDEYYHGHGCSPEGFVAGLYADVLGRAANAEEIQGWVFSLARCGSRVHLAQDFLSAAQVELAQRATTPPPIVYRPASMITLPTHFNGISYSRYQAPYRAYR